MKCCQAINFINWFLFIIAPCILTEHLIANINPVAEVIEIRGEVNLQPAVMDRLPGPAIAGRLIYNGDILRSALGSQLQFQFAAADIRVTASSISELRIDCNHEGCYIKLNYGNLFLESSSNNSDKFSVLTKYGEVILHDNEIWMTRSMTSKDKIYSIKGAVRIIPTIGTKQHIEAGERFSINSDGEISIDKISKKMLPDHIYEKLNRNQNGETKEMPFTVMNYFTDDSMIAMAFNEKAHTRPFRFTIEMGAAVIEDSQYGQTSLFPMYIGKHLKFGYNLNGFIGLSDSSKNLNTFSSLSQILAPLILDYQSPQNRVRLKMGHLDNLTFGNGMLLKRYTNTVSYPMRQDGGLELNYKSDAENFTLQLFTSSIGELTNGAGVNGIYSTAVMNISKPLRMGVGIVNDMNQFASVPDSIWSGVPPRKRSISGYQVDFTYELKSGLRNDTYFFGELTVLTYPESFRYFRSESTNGDTIIQGFERQQSFGFLGPGIHWKIGHHRNIKMAFNYSSSLHTAPFFGETYNLEQVHYVPASVLDSINSLGPNGKPYGKDEKWNNMITENRINNMDSSPYYLPKDVFALLDPTRNVYNKIGLSAEYNYHLRNYYKYSFDVKLLRETSAENPVTYYTLGMNFFIHDGLIQGISECALYFNQYFTSEPFNTSTYNENTVFGVRLGIKLLQNISLRMYRHDVFYDNNLDGEVDLNSTMGLSLVAKF